MKAGEAIARKFYFVSKI